MPCKHEGGADPCPRNNVRQCLIHKKQYNDACRPIVTSGDAAKDSDRGTASELFVEAELLRKGLLVGKPSNRHSKHDLFAKLGGRWRTIQVKTARKSRKTHFIWVPNIRRRGGVVSDLIACVDLEGHQIRWISNTGRALPKELR